ncbi:hypothetical protein J6590_024886 [Homalodisca vitripennis]|nr:hypothetical protein J6590_024886 [Homalodisca vitripennis]
MDTFWEYSEHVYYTVETCAETIDDDDETDREACCQLLTTGVDHVRFPLACKPGRALRVNHQSVPPASPASQFSAHLPNNLDRNTEPVEHRCTGRLT